jgi:Tol biopolymer transport system component
LISDKAGIGSASAGVLAFVRSLSTGGDQLTIFDRKGTAVQTLGDASEYSRVSFSPDGSRVLAARRNRPSGESNQLWTYDLAREFWSPFRTDVEGGAMFPVWSHDGTRIFFAPVRVGTQAVYQRLSNGGGEDGVLIKADEEVLPLTVSRDGQFLGIGARGAELQTHFVLKLDSKGQPVGKPTVFVRRGLGLGVEFSPDPAGPPRWIAYQATRDNRTEVFMREFDPSSPTLTPPGAGEWQVSKGGGASPRWNPAGKELLYLANDLTIMSVDFTGDPKAPTGVPRKLFKPDGIERTSQGGVATFSWSVSPDGQRFLIPIPAVPDSSTPPLTVVLNWTSLLPE